MDVPAKSFIKVVKMILSLVAIFIIILTYKGSHDNVPVNVLAMDPSQSSLLEENNFGRTQSTESRSEHVPTKTQESQEPFTDENKEYGTTTPYEQSYNYNNTNKVSEINRLSPLHLIYIKTRKTGSSTMTNILYRFALRHNVTVMTFLHGYPKTGKQFPMHKLQFLQNQSKPNFNLVMEHIYYDEQFFDKLMPGNKIFISTLRHPFDQLKSDVHYQKALKPNLPFNKFGKLRFNKENIINKFPNFKEEDTLMRVLMSPRKLKRYGQRYLKMPKIPKLYSENQFKNDSDTYLQGNRETELQEFFQDLSEKFRLILITEYYDASLVLLKRKLSWDLQDIVYSPLKRGKYSKNVKKQHSAKLLERHRELKPEEYALYEHFNQTFWNFLSEESSDFWAEVEYYQNINRKILQFCDSHYHVLKADASNIKQMLQQNTTLEIKQSVWSKRFTIYPLDCILMKTHKNTFLNLNTIKNFPRLCEDKFLGENPFAKRPSTIGIRTFVVKRNYPIFDKRYCSPLSTRYQIPIEVLYERGAYDWDDYFKKNKKFPQNFNTENGA